MIDQLFATALTSSGEAYLETKAQLIALGEDAGPFLEERIQEAPPPERLLAEVLLRRARRDEDFQAALDFLDETEREDALLAVGEPPSEWVAGRLLQDFENRVAPLFGVYLIKLERIWPYWKTVAIILYLELLTSETSALPLIELITSTPSDQYRKVATDALVAVGDESTLDAIAARLETAELGKEALERAAEAIRK